MKSFFSVIIVSFVFLLSGCGTKKVSSREDLRGTVDFEELLKLDIRQSPGGSVELQVPMGELNKLPKGAVFTEKSGTARATVTIRGDTVYLQAECDSLMQVIADYEGRLRAEGEFKRELKEDKKDFKSFLNPFIWGMVSMLIIGFVLKVKL